MSNVIELNDEVFNKLKENAEKDGVTPELWIECVVDEKSNGITKKVSAEEKRGAWENFIGAAAKLPEPEKKPPRTRFGKIAAKKLKKQGLKLEYDID